MHYRVQQKMASLDRLFTTAEAITDEEIQAHFAKYLCVKSSGLLESYVKSQVGDYVDASCSRPSSNFIRNKIKHFTNIDYKKLTDFLNTFSSDWLDQFEEEITPELKSSLNTIISNRNNIAHGNNDSISFGIMKTHYANLKLIIDILDGIIRK